MSYILDLLDLYSPNFSYFYILYMENHDIISMKYKSSRIRLNYHILITTISIRSLLANKIQCYYFVFIKLPTELSGSNILS